MSTRKWLSPVPGEPRWPACRCDSLITSRRSGLKACVSFARIVDASAMDANLGSSCQEHDLGTMAPGLWPQDMARGYGPRIMAQVQRWRPSRNACGGSSCAACGARTYCDAIKLDWQYFDCVRVKPDHAKVVGQEAPVCQWKGCSGAGLYRAPMGRGREGQYLRLCLEHVREFNASYNYFEGMSNAEVEAYQQDSLTGHRPTWRGGAHPWGHGTHRSKGGPRRVRRRAARPP